MQEGGAEIACQQVLVPDGSVFSVQWLAFPERCAQLITAPMLFERYLRLIRDCTFSLIRPAVTGEGVEFRLGNTPLALLRFSPPRQASREEGEEVEMVISGGVLVQARERHCGRFSFAMERREGEVRVTVQLVDFCPLILGSRTPSLMHRLAYRLTQAYIHKLVTVRYLSTLYRELTGERVPSRVRAARVREGRTT